MGGRGPRFVAESIGGTLNAIPDGQNIQQACNPGENQSQFVNFAEATGDFLKLFRLRWNAVSVDDRPRNRPDDYSSRPDHGVVRSDNATGKIASKTGTDWTVKKKTAA